jgi:hypothetical protein
MRISRRGFAPALLLLVAWTLQAERIGLSPDAYLDDVRFLASSEMRGRWTGSPELEKAAHFIADRFQAFGLQTAGQNGSYMQPFQVTTEAKLGKANRFRYTRAAKRVTVPADDFRPFNFSSSGKLSGLAVFAGYGITAPEYNYDDYAGLDVSGKVVVILRHEPQEYDENSVFAGRIYTRHAQFASKTSNAKLHGAAGVILISDRANHRNEGDELEKFGSSGGPADAGIPFVQVKAARLDGWFETAGKDLDNLQAAIDQDLKPRSFAFPETLRVDATIEVDRVPRTVHNIAGYLPGATDEYVVVGAHYDHIGTGEQFSMAPSQAGTIHPGADDNASGAAGVVELARWFSRQPRQKRGILFLAFAGEELGLLGSSHFVDHPSLPLDKAVAMINMDMIGRIRDGKVYVGGLATGDSLRATLDRIAPRHKLNLDYSDTTGYGSSDHTSFTTKQVPVLFFFSGLHSDYHKPTDTWDKIDAPATVELLRLIAEVTDTLRELHTRPTFVRIEPKRPAHGDHPAGPVGGGGGYGPSFGSIPDFGGGVKGVRFADVRDGSPAAKAGFQSGDILIEFDGKPIGNLEDFTYVLRSKKPGDAVVVKVLRDGKPVQATVTLEQRQ